MDINYKVLIFGLIILSVLFIGLVYFFISGLISGFNEKFSQSDKNIKILKYFGSSFCPHSRIGSNSYNIIKDFETTYKDVEVEYYWSSDKDNMNEFKKAKADYVPTITSGNYRKIEIHLPKDYNRKNQTEEEIKTAYMTNIFRQL